MGLEHRPTVAFFFFKLVSKLAAIALINPLDDLMLSPGGFLEAENPPLARAAAGARASGGFSRSTNQPGLNIKSSTELMSAIAANFDTS